GRENTTRRRFGHARRLEPQGPAEPGRHRRAQPLGRPDRADGRRGAGGHGPHRRPKHRDRAAGQLPHVRDEHDHGPGPARRPRRAQAVPAPHPRRDERPAPGAALQALQVRQDRRRHLRQLPPARRPGRIPHPRPPRPGLEP
ncbi:MAG: DNA gyrase subunit A, partial [uncultured Sphingomonadaceae bacterium]